MSTKPFQKVALTARSEIPEKEETLKHIARIVEQAGGEVHIDPVHCDVPALTKCKRFEELRNFDLIIILGGDGTTLRAVRDLKDLRIPLLTVNRGQVGFLAECTADEIEEVLPPLLRGEGMIEERLLLSCRVLRPAPQHQALRAGAGRSQSKEIHSGMVLNEVVVSQGPIARLIELRTSVNGSLLTVFRADGLIVATPTGSTAYSLSAGGPILPPSVEAILLTPINAYAFNQKPLVLSSRDTVEVDILPRESMYENTQVSLTLDGQTHVPLLRGDHIVVQANSERIRFLRRSEQSFFAKLRGKLGWGE